MYTELEKKRGNSSVAVVDQPPRILNPLPEAQFRLGGISRSKLYELIKESRLEVVKIGSRSFIPEASLQSFASQLGVK
jgi:predicted DNA-binding transcriptional regulator AlpA